MAKIAHTMIRVLDETRSCAFYKTAFDLNVAGRYPFDGFTLVYLSNDACSVELELTVNHGRTASYTPGDGYGHMAVVVDDIAADHARLTQAGLNPRPIVEFLREGSMFARFFFVDDPDGYKIEVLQRTVASGDPPQRSRPGGTAGGAVDAEPRPAHVRDAGCDIEPGHGAGALLGAHPRALRRVGHPARRTERGRTPGHRDGLWLRRGRRRDALRARCRGARRATVPPSATAGPQRDLHGSRLHRHDAVGTAVAGTVLKLSGALAGSWREALVLHPIPLLYGLLVSGMLITVNRMRELIGAEVFLNLLLGRYHQPVEEERIFLFIDLIGSTAYARRHGDLRAQAFLSAIFAALADPVRRSRGSIDDYIGDMALVTWPLAVGTADARCVACVFDFFATITSDRERWLREFGQVPQFRAALHGGRVVTAEVGLDRHKIAYFGDVVNTTGRLESLCRVLDAPVLISSDLFDRMTPSAARGSRDRSGPPRGQGAGRSRRRVRPSHHGGRVAARRA